MKVLNVVGAIFFALVAIGATSLLTWRDFRDSGRLKDEVAAAAAAGAPATDPDVAAATDLAGKLKVGGIVTGALAALSAVLGGAMFVKKDGLKYLPLAVVAAAGAAIAFNPSYGTGPFAPMSARTLSFIVAGAAAAHALTAWSLLRVRTRSFTRSPAFATA
jgi:hypothetical protein